MTNGDADPQETYEWLESLDAVLRTQGSDRVRYLIESLIDRARQEGVPAPTATRTPYVNTIPLSEQPTFPGDRDLERQIKSVIRWNAMAMVHKANKTTNVGGHIATYASAATLYEIGFNHFFRGRTATNAGDIVYFQGHASPGMYARAFVEGRLGEQQLKNFRQELNPGGGLSSYPHPWLMPDFWQFPTGSMGIGPISSIYHARFMRYLTHRGLLDCSGRKVWGVFGDGEMDEPESMSALTRPIRSARTPNAIPPTAEAISVTDTRAPASPDVRENSARMASRANA